MAEDYQKSMKYLVIESTMIFNLHFCVLASSNQSMFLSEIFFLPDLCMPDRSSQKCHIFSFFLFKLERW